MEKNASTIPVSPRKYDPFCNFFCSHVRGALLFLPMVTGKTTRERASHAVIPPCRNPWLEKWKCVELGNLSCRVNNCLLLQTKVAKKPKHFNLPTGIRVKTEEVLKLLPMLHHVFLHSRSSSPTLVSHID